MKDTLFFGVLFFTVFIGFLVYSLIAAVVFRIRTGRWPTDQDTFL